MCVFFLLLLLLGTSVKNMKNTNLCHVSSEYIVYELCNVYTVIESNSACMWVERARKRRKHKIFLHRTSKLTKYGQNMNIYPLRFRGFRRYSAGRWCHWLFICWCFLSDEMFMHFIFVIHIHIHHRNDTTLYFCFSRFVRSLQFPRSIQPFVFFRFIFSFVPKI